MKKPVAKICCFFVLLFMLASDMTCAFPVFAGEMTDRVVRIGYYTGDTSLQDGFTDEERKSGYAYEYYQKIASLNGWGYQYVYGTKEEVLDKLIAGEVDIVAGIYQTDKLSEQVLFSAYDMGLPGEPCYFVVNADRPELLNELEYAQEKLNVSESNFTFTLYQKYYHKDSRFQILSDQEIAWLEEKGSLNVGYVRKCLPLSGQKDGEPIGIAKELLDLVAGYLEIPLNPICYDNVSLMEEGLKNGEVDAAFPIYADPWVSEAEGFLQTDAVVSDRVMIVYQGEYRNDLMDKVALSRTGVGQNFYMSIYYPDAEIVYYDSRDAAFGAIQNGEADCMLGASSILHRFVLEHEEFQNLNIAYLDISEEFSIAVRRDEYILAGILNKAVRQFDDATMTNAMIRYSSVENVYTFEKLIQHNAFTVIAALSTFFAILLIVFVSYRRKTKQFNREQVEIRAALEDALDAAKSASEAKTTFLSSMSHDIRTPLNGIIGMTAIAETRIEDKARVKDCLKKITLSGKHLLALINEVLDMSKIESGEIYLNEEVFEFSSLMDDLISLNRQQVDAKHHNLAVYTLDITHEEVIGDDVRLQQVLTNLVGNAVKYTPDGGKIEITLSEKPSNNPKMGCFEFVVKDNGVGMSEEYLPHVFDAFTRAENESTFHTQGTGLGMAIARNIIRMMGGDITVESKVGEGSKFTIMLYLKLADVKFVSYEEFEGLNVLVVDDDQMICESTEFLLSEMGMTGEWVLSGKEAVERVEERHKKGEDYFAVLIDWKMPDMDGIEAVKAIRERVGSSVYIIIFSAYDWSSIEEEATLAGVDGFMGKPLFCSRIVHQFRQLLGNEAKDSGDELSNLLKQVDLTNKRALIAEDNEINAEIAMEILKMTGLDVEWAHDGREALDMMTVSASGYYDCIFMDIQMPVMNGIDSAAAIRASEHPDAKTIPIFAMTANAFLDDVQRILNAGMNEHIAKPLNFDKLTEILSRYLG